VSEKNHASGILLDSMTTLSAENTLPSDLRLIHQLQLQQLQTQCQACTGCTIMDAFKAHSPLGLANRAQWVTQCSCSSHQLTCCTAKRFEGVDGHAAAFKTGLESEHLLCSVADVAVAWMIKRSVNMTFLPLNHVVNKQLC